MADRVVTDRDVIDIEKDRIGHGTDEMDASREKGRF